MKNLIINDTSFPNNNEYKIINSIVAKMINIFFFINSLLFNEASMYFIFNTMNNITDMFIIKEQLFNGTALVRKNTIRKNDNTVIIFSIT